MPVKKRDVERATDIIDQAAQASELFLEADISQARKGVEPEKHPDFDGMHCVEEGCGVELPALRLEMGRVRCVDCQGHKELLKKLGPR
jgi:hypothetical protein